MLCCLVVKLVHVKVGTVQHVGHHFLLVVHGVCTTMAVSMPGVEVLASLN